MWWLILAIYFAFLAWSAYSVIREVAYWDGYLKGFADGVESGNKIYMEIFRREA